MAVVLFKTVTFDREFSSFKASLIQSLASILLIFALELNRYPPSSGFSSTINTLAPDRAAAKAAVKPVTPPPTTITSQ